jgi:hypothetical protein
MLGLGVVAAAAVFGAMISEEGRLAHGGGLLESDHIEAEDVEP